MIEAIAMRRIVIVEMRMWHADVDVDARMRIDW